MNFKEKGTGAQREPVREHAHKVACPDVYRGPYRAEDASECYATEVSVAVAAIEGQGKKVGAFMGESLIGCGGQIIPPAGYFEAMGDLMTWLGEGKLAWREDVQEGFENIPATLLRLYDGRNQGKQLLKL